MAQASDPKDMLLFVAVHTHGNFTPRFVHSLARFTAHLPIWGVPHAIGIVEDTLVDRGRDKAVHAMLEGDFTHLLFLDADIEFEPEHVLRLIKARKDVVAGAYRHKNDSGRFSVFFSQGNDGMVPWDEAAQAMEVDAAGTGFMLIARGVFETLRDTLPEIAYKAEGEGGKIIEMHAFFEHKVIDGRRMTEDYVFCNRWRAAGGSVWIVPGLKLGHWGRKVWDGALVDQLNFAREAPAEKAPE